MDEGSHAVNISASTIKKSNHVTSFLQIVPVSVQSGGNRSTTYAFLDSGSTGSKCQGSTTSQRHGRYLEHSWHTWDARFEDREGSYHNKGTTFKGAFDWSVCTLINLVGKHNIWLQGTEEQIQTPECFH